MKQISAMVREFHDRFGVPVLTTPTIPSDDRCALRVALIEEECKELKEGIAAGDIIEIADALADLNYVIHGTAHEFGIPLDAVSEEVHRSNMTKVWADGTVHVLEDGKVLKPPTYMRPQINFILAVCNNEASEIYEFLVTSFLDAMNDIGRYGHAKYKEHSFHHRAKSGDSSRGEIEERTSSKAIGEHIKSHYAEYLDGILHDHFGTKKHQLAAAAFNAMMEFHFAGLEDEGRHD